MSESIQPKFSMDGFPIERDPQDETILDKIKKNLKPKKFPENATLWYMGEIGDMEKVTQVLE